MKKIIPSIIVVIIFILSCNTLNFMEREVSKTMLDSYEIRVKLIINGEVKIKMSPDIVVIDAINGRLITPFDRSSVAVIENRQKNVYLNDKIIQSPMIIKSNLHKSITLNGKRYFGKIKIIPIKHGFTTLNILPIEEYLVCVLPSEMPLYFNIEALKTQVVIARTYSYRFMLRFARRTFDVDNTTAYQAYNGVPVNIKLKDFVKIKKAIQQTFGQVILYGNSPIVAYYHANSGGIIFSGKEYFGNNSDFPYLVHKKDPFSIGYPGAKWTYSISKKEFEEKFNTANIDYNNFIQTNDEDLVQKLKINETIYSTKTTRRIIGYKNIKSTKFKIIVYDDSIVFNGIGYGHGVGLSQWGAQGMAIKDYNYKEIIEFYYPNTYIGLY